MAALAVKIVAPLKDAVLRGPDRIRLVGAGPALLPPGLAAGDLRYRWYSSLHPLEKNPTSYSLNATALAHPPAAIVEPSDVPPSPLPDWWRSLSPGTHALTFAVSDQAGEDAAAQAAVRSGGVTGGAVGESACLVHVLRAQLLTPSAGATLAKRRSTFEVGGPLLWCTPEYQNVNRLRYRFRFRPASAAGGNAVDLLPPFGSFVPDPVKDMPDRVRYAGPWEPVARRPGAAGEPDKPACLRWTGALPSTLAAGTYMLSLRVEDARDPEDVEDPARFDASAPIAVTVVP
jgi:hypothetical protein